MLISLLNLLLISNALILRKDKSILFSRIVMVSLTLTSFLAFNNLFFLSLDKSIGIFGDLFCKIAYSLSQIFNVFIFTFLYPIMVNFKPENIILFCSLSITISILTLILLLFVFISNELFKVANIAFFIITKDA